MRRSVKYGLYGAVLAGVTAATTAAVAATGPTHHPKSVHLLVDGKSRTVQTEAADVSGVLADAGYRVSAHDIVAPAASSPLTSGETVVFKRGRLLHLDVDGQAKNVWTTAPTVAAALTDLGFSSSDFVSVSRSTRLPLDPTSLTLRLPKQVVVVHDKARRHVTTTDATVGDVLHDLGVTMYRHDRLTPGVAAPVTDHMRIVLDRVVIKRVVAREAIPYSVVRHYNSSAYKGTTSVTTYGREGSRRLVYKVTYVNGKPTRRVLVARHTVSQPRSQVESIGTKSRPAPTPAPAPVASSSSSGLNWDAVASCESGGNWSINTGNGFYGGLQFSLSTWQSEGGTAYASRPDLASRDQQIAIATKLYQSQGSSPWPVCGAYL